MNHGDEPGSSVSVQSCAGSRSWSRAPSSLLGCKYPEEKILGGCIVPPKVVRKSVGRGTRGHGTNNERRKLAITLGWCVEAVPDRGVGGSGWCFGQFLWVSRVSLCPCSECAGIPTDPELPKLPYAAGTWSGRALRGVFSWSLPSLPTAEAAEGAVLAGHGPGSWHLPNLGPIIPWQLSESSGSKEGRAVFPIPMPFLSLPSLHLFHVGAGLTPFHEPLLGRSILLQLLAPEQLGGVGRGWF